jgi:hypothetical protein
MEKASEEVMHQSHYLIQAAKAGNIVQFLSGKTVSQFLGSEWVKAHPDVLPEIAKLQSLINEV